MSRYVFVKSCVRPVTLFLIASIGFFPNHASAQSTDHEVVFWIKAFISAPNNGIASSDFNKTSTGKWGLRAPLTGGAGRVLPLPQGCFGIDERQFSNDPLSSARVTFEARILFTAREMRLEKFQGRDLVRIGETTNFDCQTGAQLQPPRKADVSTVSVGSIKASQNGRIQVFNVRSSSPNPFYSIGFISAPRIDFELVFTFNVIRQNLTIKGVTGAFPSFEAYYKLDGGPIVKVLNRSPASGAGPLTLADFGTGINTINFEEKISFIAD